MVLFTDGLTEAMNRKDEQFDVERVMDIIENNNEKDVEDIKMNIFHEVFSYMDYQYDDITLCIIKKI